MQALEKKPQKRVRDMHAFVEGLQKANGIAIDEPSANQTVSQTVILNREDFPKERRFNLPVIGAAVRVPLY